MRSNPPPYPTPSNHPALLRAEALDLSYGGPLVVECLTTDIPAGEITAIIGANGCGKTTLLRALARLLKPISGSVLLDGKLIQRYPTKEVARRLGLLPQFPRAPDGVTVGDLVRRGRYPHQGIFDQWSSDDAAAVDRALELTAMSPLRERVVGELSGGQRQRAWIAMVLAQDTPLMLLDEPTASLDISYQMEVLDLLADLNEVEGRTIVMVLHDLNQACRYASHLIAMVDGKIETSGPPAFVVDAALIERVFGLACQVVDDPVTGTPLCIPLGRDARNRVTKERGLT